jgi:hypothetical protein
VNSFGKAFVQVQNCLLKKMHMAQTKTMTDSTRKRQKKEDSASFVQKLKKSYNDLLHFSTRKHNLVSLILYSGI